MSNPEKKDESISNWWFALLIAICILLWVLGLWGTHEYVNSQYVANKPEDVLTNPGVFGDSSGAINALFSALAFAGVIFAIILQKKELQLQREELKQTREELEGQKHEFEQQNETLKRQRFENTFFNMLSLQQEIVNNLSFSYLRSETIGQNEVGNNINVPKNVTISARELFSFLYTEQRCKILLADNIYIPATPLKTLLTEDVTVHVEKDTNSFWAKGEDIPLKEYQAKKLTMNNLYIMYDHQTIFDHYFRHLYRIIKFVNETPLLPDSFDDRYQYTSMVRAQLSKYELVWLFYNCLSDNGKDKFKPLIEKYALLKNLRFELLAKPEHENLYDNSAYEKTSPQEN